MERNAVLFLVLSVVIIIVYSMVVPPAPPQAPKPVAPSQEAPPVRGGVATPLMSEEPPALAPGPERVVTVETDLYRATLSTRGAVITSWRLTRYTDRKSTRLNSSHIQKSRMPSSA